MSVDSDQSEGGARVEPHSELDRGGADGDELDQRAELARREENLERDLGVVLGVLVVFCLGLALVVLTRDGDEEPVVSGFVEQQQPAEALRYRLMVGPWLQQWERWRVRQGERKNGVLNEGLELVFFEQGDEDFAGRSGAFYLVGEGKICLELEFMRQLEMMGEGDARWGLLYVLAHEYAHHVQWCMGDGALAAGGLRSGVVASDVELSGVGSQRRELHADFVAGLLLKEWSLERGRTLADVERSVAGAMEWTLMLGERRVAQQFEGHERAQLVDEEPNRQAKARWDWSVWTHGSLEQRRRSLALGLAMRERRYYPLRSWVMPVAE